MSAVPHSYAEDVFARADAQKFLFSDKPSWSDLLGIELPSGTKRRILVLRNHTFETVGALVSVFARYGGWDADFLLSDYDDSVSFDGNTDADAILLWLDLSTYKMEAGELAGWLASRVENIRKSATVPVVAAVWTTGNENCGKQIENALRTFAGVHFADVRKAVADALGECVESARMRSVGGTPLDREQQAVVARQLGFRWLPSVLLPPLKAVALDLDGTLHDGVLGEDGIGGVKLSVSHEKLQKSLKLLKERGIFLALISRNEEEDVRKLFEKREDYPLRWEDFSATEAGWGEKASGIGRIAEKLRVGVDAVLFVDDNPGELAAVGSVFPDVKTLWASHKVSESEHAVDFYPGLWSWKTTREDALRVGDLHASGDRSRIWERSENEDDYFRALQVRLTYAVNPVSQLGRLAELSQKTNQFNLSLSRFGEPRICEILKSPQSAAVSVDLSDRLSESGVIAFVAATLEGETLVVKEICVSCRALGRRLENALVLRSLRRMPIYAGCREVAFNFSRGPRNAPALNWLEELSGGPLPENSLVVTVEKSKIGDLPFNEEICFYDG